jgi:nucleoside-diphosphate-sugar epimerase
MAALVTAAAGPDGGHLGLHLLARGGRVTGVDISTDSYDLALKSACANHPRGLDGFERIGADVIEAFADIGKLNSLRGYRPTTPLAEGIPRFVQWYRRYHEV